jgi:hypothetical protein
MDWHWLYSAFLPTLQHYRILEGACQREFKKIEYKYRCERLPQWKKPVITTGKEKLVGGIHPDFRMSA